MINPFFSSLQPVIAKLGLHRKGVEEMAVVFARFFYVTPILMIFLWIKGMPDKIDRYFWPTMLALILLEIPSQWFYHQALKADKISLVQPIQTLLVYPLMFSFFVFKGWSWGAFCGVIIVSMGVYLLQLQKLEGEFSLKRFFEPIKALKNNLASRHMLTAVLLWSITTPLQKITSEMSSPAFMGVIYLSGCSLGVILWRVINRQSVMPIIFPPEMHKLMPTGLVAGIASIGQYWSLSIMNPVYAISLKDIRIILIMMWDKLFFKTHISRGQAMATMMILAGSIMVGVSILM